MGRTRERGVWGESLGDSRDVGVLLKGGRGRTTLRAACLRVCMGGGRWRGKGETRLRNEQASENKVEARSRTSKKGQKTKYYFPPEFSKTCLGSFKLRPVKPDLFNLRAAPPFPLPAHPCSPTRQGRVCVFCSLDMSERVEGGPWLFGSGD